MTSVILILWEKAFPSFTLQNNMLVSGNAFLVYNR